MQAYLLPHLLENGARRHPENTAVIGDDGVLTYAELDLEANRQAARLRECGVRPGNRVVLMMEKSSRAIASLLAILKTGAAYVPIDLTSPADRVDFIIRNCAAELLLTTSRIARKLGPSLNPETGLQTLAIIDGAGEEFLAPFRLVGFQASSGDDTQPGPVLRINDGNPAYILHTSGSTGVPKGVVISHANALSFVNMAADYFEVSASDRLACHAPLHFDLSIFDVFVALKTGATIVLIPENLSIFPTRLAQYIDTKQVTIWNSIASVLSLLSDRGQLERLPFLALRLVLFSGDILPVKHLRNLKTHMTRARFFNVYGQTEANSSTCYEVIEIPNHDAWTIPIGKPFPNFEVFILDDDRRFVQCPGEIGELHVSGPTVALGYLNDRARTAESFGIDPRSEDIERRAYRTGDIVTIDENLDMVFLGRKDQQVKSRGYRIHLGEIESNLKKHVSIVEAIVIAVPDELFGNRLLGYISLVAGDDVSDVDILDFCSGLLPRYMLPDEIVFLQEFPRTTTGKVDRKRLGQTSLNRKAG